MADLSTAEAFVREHGDTIDQARLTRLLEGTPAADDAVEALVGDQRQDGGWAPSWSTDYSSVDATCFRLTLAEELGLPRSDPHLARALAFLAERQKRDGTWQEESSVANTAPPWVRPGEAPATIYLTASSAFWMALLGDDLRTAGRGADFIAGQLEADGHLETYPHAHWLSSGLFRLLGRSDEEGAVTGYLGRHVEKLSAGSLAWLITTLGAAGVPPADELVRAAASRLSDMQREDGRWASDDGSHRDVHTTLEAIRALRFADLDTA